MDNGWYSLPHDVKIPNQHSLGTDGQAREEEEEEEEVIHPDSLKVKQTEGAQC